MACRYQPFSKSNAVLHVLDKAIENTNGWTKILPLSNTAKYWKYYSLNLMCANQCKKNEKKECMNNKINYEESLKNNI